MALIAATENIAPPAGMPSVTELSVTGMTCNNCARHVNDAIRSVEGVAGAKVRLEAGRATVRWSSPPKLSAVIGAVKEAGFEATEIERAAPESDGGWSPLAGWRFNVALGAICTIPLMAGDWLFGLGMANWFRWLGFGLALPVQVLCGARFYRGAWMQMKAGESNMDTLVALGSTTAFGYSVWALFSGAMGHVYFMESAAIITLISAGHWMEARTSAKAEGSLKALLDLAPKMARRREISGAEVMVPAGELKLAEIVILKPGDQTPVDGKILSGETSVDESMLTGESLPVEKKPGDTMCAGTLNINGQVELRVTATGEETALAQIIAVVERAQSSRAEIQRLGDRVSAIFVPIVVTVAIAAGLWWGLAPNHAANVHGWLGKFLWPSAIPETPLASALIHAAAVLIVACPCAMGLATPVALMAGANGAARRGILIRDGVALERAGQITSLVFDKTGTLTKGTPTVAATEFFPAEDVIKVDRQQLAAALARPSSHPISQAVAQLGKGEFAFSDWQEVRGSGVQGNLEMEGKIHEVRLGSIRWLREMGVDLKPAAGFESEWAQKGGTLLGMAAGNRLLGMLAVRDILKNGAEKVVRQLREQGLKIYLVTGDNEVTARAIARQAGILEENVRAEVRPEGKAEFLNQLREAGERVAFVGDGINDAPALEAADLGIAVSRASDVAREAADMILLKSEIEAVPEALGLARATLRTIKQNLFWAFFYNSAGIPLAALGFMSPILCAAAMGFSDLLVIGNSLRLLRRGSGSRDS